jgi:atypical dual specificity phosphatase
MSTVEGAALAGLIAGCVIAGVVVVLLTSFSIAYLAFQKHCCSLDGDRCSARLFLWSCLGCTVCTQQCIRKGWWHEIDERVYVGAMPVQCLGHIRQLHALGVRGVLNTMEEYAGPVAAYEAMGIEQLRLPVVDHREATMEQVQQGVEFVQRHVDAGAAVLIHCKGGHGRSAAIGFAWLLHRRRMSPKEAQVHILSCRKVRKKLYKQPELLKYHRQVVLGLPPDLEQERLDREAEKRHGRKKKHKKKNKGTKNDVSSKGSKHTAKVVPVTAVARATDKSS